MFSPLVFHDVNLCKLFVFSRTRFSCNSKFSGSERFDERKFTPVSIVNYPAFSMHCFESQLRGRETVRYFTSVAARISELATTENKSS